MFPNQFPEVGNVFIFAKNKGKQPPVGHLEPHLRVAEVLAAVGWPAIVRGGTDSLHSGENGISQKTSEEIDFGDEKVGFSEVNLTGGYEPGPKTESRTWLCGYERWSRGETGKTPLLLHFQF